MIPEPEITRLYLAAINAAAMGNCGQASVGLNYLLSGRQRISSLSNTDAPWAGQLQQDWQRVLDAYCAKYSLEQEREAADIGADFCSEVSNGPLM